MNFFGRMMQPAAPGLTAADAVNRHANDEIIVIDVRDYNEVAMTGKAKGAEHIPLMMLQAHATPSHPDFNEAVFKANKPIVVYCASGGRSEMARRALQQLGYDDVHNIGGLMHWQAAGGACE